MSPDFEVPQVNREAKIKIPDCDVGYKLKVGVDKQVICIGCWGGGKEPGRKHSDSGCADLGSAGPLEAVKGARAWW